jgi:hypothetical protein
MIFRSNDLAFMFAAFGVQVQFGGYIAQGIFDQPEVIRLADRGFGGVEAANPALKLPFNAFNPMPANKDTLAVGGDTYSVIEHTTDGDGAIVTYALKGPIS